MKKLIVCALIACGMAPASAQEYGLFNNIGANLGVGTEGISVGVATPITEYLELSAGVNFMPGIKIKETVNIDATLPFEGYSLRDVKIEGNLARTTFDLKLNVYPGGASLPIFIVGGLSFSGKNIGKLEGFSQDVAQVYVDHPEYAGMISTKIDEYELGFDRKGYVNGDIRVKSVRPYVGLGYGRLIPKNRIGFRLELGCQFMGKMKIYQNDKELSESLTGSDNSDLSKIIDKLKVYPVLKLTLTGRIL